MEVQQLKLSAMLKTVGESACSSISDLVGAEVQLNKALALLRTVGESTCSSVSDVVARQFLLRLRLAGRNGEQENGKNAGSSVPAVQHASYQSAWRHLKKSRVKKSDGPRK